MVDAPSHVRALLDAVDGLDPARIDDALDSALRAGSVEHVVQLVLMPFLRAIGDRWEEGTITVAHEHFGSQAVARRLTALGVDLPAGHGPLVVMACPPGERHDMVLSCFGLLLQREGWRVRLLGADTPTAALAVVCHQLRPDLVVLAGTRPSVFTSRLGSLRRLAAEHLVATGGNGASQSVAADLGAVLLPPDPVPAVDVVMSLVRPGTDPDEAPVDLGGYEGLPGAG